MENTEVKETSEESTLLGKPADSAVDEKAKAEAGAEELKNETPEAKTARETKEAAEAAAKAVPEKYELKMPDGMKLDEKLMESVSPILKKYNITQAGAQELADAYAPHVKAQVEAKSKAAMDGFKAITDGWKAETLKILGAEPDKAMAPAAKFMNTFGTPKLREMLEETGLGNHPELVQAFINAGKAIGTDSFADPNKSSTGKASIDVLYPSMKE